MSFQAYLDNAEAKTGITPNEFVARAAKRGYDTSTKTGVVVSWLKADFGLGHGHAMAIAYVIKNGAQISDTHIGSTGSHRDPSNTLELGGVRHRR